jgi:hypothetical protein
VRFAIAGCLVCCACVACSGPSSVPPDSDGSLGDTGTDVLADSDGNTVDGGVDDILVDLDSATDLDSGAAPDTEPDVSEDTNVDTPDSPDVSDAPELPECEPGFPGEATLVWSVQGEDVVFSSPRLADLNGDGVLDVVFGQGMEFTENRVEGRGAVTALDGSTGAVLWSVPTRAEMVGSPMIADLDGDGGVEVALGGRFAALVVLDGQTGALWWEFYPRGNAQRDGYHNFYTGVVIHDVDVDGVRDLLMPNGGDSTKAPFSPRPPGSLLVISGATGEVLRRTGLPDEGETYMSIYVHRPAGDSDPWVVFGTGGETWSGSLWTAPLTAVLDGDISGARELVAPTTHKGMIGPPALVDLTGDGVREVVAPAFDGRLVATTFAEGESLWSVVPEVTSETYATPAVGQFNRDEVPDLFYQTAQGTWPEYWGSTARMVDGDTGEILWSEESSFALFPSALAVDLNGDGRDEVIYASSDLEFQRVRRRVLDTCTLEAAPLLPDAPGGGVSTPWAGDIDGDGLLDLVWLTSSPSGFGGVWTAERYEFEEVTVPPSGGWRGYLGTNSNGTYNP